MPFSEALKLKVRRKAAFRCCRCNEIGIDVHHIIPQADSGSDDIDNAAPLCQNCHARFGGNPDKRKEIKQMRDLWYEVVQEKYHGDREKLESINALVLEIQSKQEDQSTELKLLKERLERELAELTKSSKDMHGSGSAEVQHKVSEYVSATRLGDNLYANFQCAKCSTSIGLLIGASKCPKCGEPIPQ